MRTRLIPYTGWLVLALGGIGGTSCSNLDLGQERDPPGPLNVNHVVFLDQRRGINPDLLNADAEKIAAGIASQGRSCDFVNPCPPPVQCGYLLFQGASSGLFLEYDVEADGRDVFPNSCHDPESVQEVAPGVDSVIRIGFNKLIDNDTIFGSVTGEVDSRAVTLRDSAGNDVPAAEIFYDLSGSPVFTSDPNLLPYGPALAFAPAEPLRPGETYTITLNEQFIVARNNKETFQPEDRTFTFTVENLFMFVRDTEVAGNPISVHCPEETADATDTVCELSSPIEGDAIDSDPDTELYYTFNADVDISSATISVLDPGGNPVPINVDVIRDPSFPSPANDPLPRLRRLSIQRSDGQSWVTGNGYEITITGVRAAAGGAVAPSFTATFNVQ